MQRREQREQKKWEVNSEPQLEETWRGIPCFKNMWVMKMSATSMAVTVSVVGMKILSLDNWLMTTRMVVKLLEAGNCSMKSMLTECQRRSGIGSSCRSP